MLLNIYELEKNGNIEYLIKVFSLWPSFYNLKGKGGPPTKGFVYPKKSIFVKFKIDIMWT
jgi:hypothetical protein